MDLDRLLDRLLIEDRWLVFNFFVAYSRFEYSLKKAGYVQESGDGIEIQVEKFVSDISDDFNPERTDELEEAVDYLLARPSQAQTLKEDGSLGFGVHPSTGIGPYAHRVYHSLRIARNNLFHGGKFGDGTMEEPGRDEQLLRSCLKVLEEFLRLDDDLHEVFYG